MSVAVLYLKSFTRAFSATISKKSELVMIFERKTLAYKE